MEEYRFKIFDCEYGIKLYDCMKFDVSYLKSNGRNEMSSKEVWVDWITAITSTWPKHQLVIYARGESFDVYGYDTVEVFERDYDTSKNYLNFKISSRKDFNMIIESKKLNLL